MGCKASILAPVLSFSSHFILVDIFFFSHSQWCSGPHIEVLGGPYVVTEFKSLSLQQPIQASTLTFLLALWPLFSIIIFIMSLLTLKLVLITGLLNNEMIAAFSSGDWNHTASTSQDSHYSRFSETTNKRVHRWASHYPCCLEEKAQSLWVNLQVAVSSTQCNYSTEQDLCIQVENEMCSIPNIHTNLPAWRKIHIVRMNQTKLER